MSVANNLEKILKEIPSHVQLCAISKTKPESDILEAYAAGQRHFGENKVQEMTEKEEGLPKDICWHQVGTLQRNKVKYLAPYVHLIHSVESFKLLKEIHKEGEKNNRVIDVLLQMHIAEEESKFGMDKTELEDLLQHPDRKSLSHVRIRGLMGMATFTEDNKQIAKEFRGLKSLYDELVRNNPFSPDIQLDTLSMGMSGDYKIAIEEGSTLVRVGSAIFGNRNYN